MSNTSQYQHGEENNINSLHNRQQQKQQHPVVQAILLQNNSFASVNSSTPTSNNTTHATSHQSSKIKKLTQTLAWRSAHVQSPNYSLTIESKTISIQQIHTESELYGTGAMVWPASLVLVKYLEWTKTKWFSTTTTANNKRRGKTVVVDLGAGTGVTSLGMAFLLSSQQNQTSTNEEGRKNKSLVICTDGCGLVVKLAKKNVQRVAAQQQKLLKNGPSDNGEIKKNNSNNNSAAQDEDTFQIESCEIRVREYHWGDGTLNKELLLEGVNNNDDESEKGHCDIILVSDCVLPKLYPIEPLVNALDELSGPHTVAYISYEERYYPEYDPKEYFMALAVQKGLEVKVVPQQEQHPVYSVEDIEIWEVRRKRFGV